MEQKSYKWNSEDYAKQSCAQFKWARELIDKLNLSGRESVLDIGCGDGKVTALLGAYLPDGSVTGIDSSAEMIALAKKNHQPENYPNLFFTEMDATKLEFVDKFDIAFSNAVLHWVKDHVSVLKGVKKSLKESGRILFQMGGKGNAQDVVDIVTEIIHEKQWKSYFIDFSFPYNFASPEEYAGWLRQAGLVPKRAELLDKDMSQKGKDGLAGWVRTTWMPFIDRVPEEKKNELIDEVVNRYTARFPVDADGFVHVKMVRLEIEAVKI